MKIEKERIQDRKIQTTAYSGEWWYCFEIYPNVYFVLGLYWNEIKLDNRHSSYSFINKNTNLIQIPWYLSFGGLFTAGIASSRDFNHDYGALDFKVLWTGQGR